MDIEAADRDPERDYHTIVIYVEGRHYQTLTDRFAGLVARGLLQQFDADTYRLTPQGAQSLGDGTAG